jgi:hypothetical protein
MMLKGLIGVRRLGEKTMHVFYTQQEAADYLMVSRSMISLALHGKFKKSKNVIMNHEVIFLEKGKTL